MCLCPALRPRQVRSHPTTLSAPTRPPLKRKRRLLQLDSFRGSITRLQHSLSTLRREGRPSTTQDSFPAAGQALPDGLGYPQGSCERFRGVSYISSSFPKLSWRNVFSGMAGQMNGYSNKRPGGRSHQGQEGSFTRPDPAIPRRAAHPTMLRMVPGPTLFHQATSIVVETELHHHHSFALPCLRKRMVRWARPAPGGTSTRLRPVESD